MDSTSLEQEVKQTSPGILFFLPLLHIAWSDEVLTPTEIQLLEKMINSQDWLQKSEKDFLCARLDPANPPSPQQLKNWLKIIKQSSRELPSENRKDLLDISVQLANLGTENDPATYKNEATRAALEEIEKALGIISKEAVREMLAARRSEIPIPDAKAVSASFDVSALQKRLDGPYAEIKQKVKLILSDPAFSYELAGEEKDAYRETVFTWCKYLADQGLGALSYSKEGGGMGDMGSYVAVFETMGYHDLSLLIKFGVQFGLFGGSIMGLGTSYHHKKYLPSVGKLDLAGCFAMTEANHGSNVRDIETTAIYDPEKQEFVVHTPHHHAHKEYIGNAAVHGQMASVFAQLETNGERYGVHAILVPIRDDAGNPMPGVRIEDSGRKLGLNGVDNGRIWFNQVRVPRANLLNRFADVSEDGTYSSPIASESRRFFTMLGTLVGGRICVPMAGLSAAKSGLTIAIKYATQRRQFGPSDQPEVPIMSYPSHQRRLLPLLAESYAFHFAHEWLADKFIHMEEEDGREIEAIAAGLKAQSTWFTTKALQECREACGGNGYLYVNRFAHLKAGTEIFTTFEGDNTVLLQLVAKARLSEFRRDFSSMNFFGMVNFVAGQATKVITEKNPIAVRNTDSEHLRDADFQLQSFKHREESLVMSAARRIKHRIDKGMDSYEAFIEVQTHLLTMAKAYIDRLVMEQFVDAVAKLEDEGLKKIMDTVRSLYGLHHIETHQAWFLRNGFLSASKASAIRKEVDTLCAEVKDQAVHLVDAFGIPDALLGAPIAI